MGPRVLWIGIGGSIFFAVLERAKLLLAQKRPNPRMVTGQVTWCTSTKDTMEPWTNIEIPWTNLLESTHVSMKSDISTTSLMKRRL
nr:S-adenosylmethionine carrier 1, chloroplastic/mitochondrial-like isoform X2 [Tanacetum cinerariifolium]